MMKKVLIVGGSEEFTGAVFLAGISALRAGAGSVIVMAPEKVAWALNALSPDLMTRKLKGAYLSKAHEAAIRTQMKTADILLIGNGAGTRAGTAALMRSLLRSPILKVVDADALKVLRGNAVENAILTPNAGEWALLKKNNSIRKLLAENVVIKKGMPTEILSAKKTFRMRHTNRGLEKAGTGDVLAGMCAGFLACPPKPRRRGAQDTLLFAAAKAACETGNKIADILTRKKKGYYFLASDIADELLKA
jgi:NAD(P)H-hydrate epimerase